MEIEHRNIIAMVRRRSIGDVGRPPNKELPRFGSIGKDSREFGERAAGVRRYIESGVFRDPVKESDPYQLGLRIVHRKDGTTFHYQYFSAEEGGARRMVKIGEFPEMSLAEARRIASIIETLIKDYDIDPFAGLLRKRIEELKRLGTKWRPQ